MNQFALVETLFLSVKTYVSVVTAWHQYGDGHLEVTALKALSRL